jgi:thymidylate synthase
MEHEEYQYLNLLKKCLLGNKRQTRNSETYSLFTEMLSFNLMKGFPLLTTKKVFIRGIFEELMFFIRGQTNTKLLEYKGVNIWKPNTTKEFIESCNLPYNEGDMGPMYGFQWIHFNAEYKDCSTDYNGMGYNQLEEVINLLIKDPYSRRILMTTYNPLQAKQGVLYPCHSIVIQFYVDNMNMISMSMYQRSSDAFLGLPYNIASNALLLHLICSTVNKRINKNKYSVGKLNIILGDVHIYKDHIDAVNQQDRKIHHMISQQ